MGSATIGTLAPEPGSASRLLPGGNIFNQALCYPPMFAQVYLRVAKKYGCDLSADEVLRRYRWAAADALGTASQHSARAVQTAPPASLPATWAGV